jgi:hypothetical protein
MGFDRSVLNLMGRQSIEKIETEKKPWERHGDFPDQTLETSKSNNEEYL